MKGFATSIWDGGGPGAASTAVVGAMRSVLLDQGVVENPDNEEDGGNGSYDVGCIN